MAKDIKIEVPIPGTPEKAIFDSAELYVENEGMMTEHMNRLPGQICYWNALTTKYKESLLELQNAFTIWMAQKKHAIDGGAGKFKSETAKEEAVMVQFTQEYMEWRKKVADITYYVNVLSDSICKALMAKKDLIVSMGANLRKEMDTGITVGDGKMNVKVVNSALETKLN